ncbi:MAG: orotate phosphoribosyltransferase [Planctomycetes bacterium]|nr:orotate phosphoribosyltransferase [Planctomycetota bacterium]MCC7173011.1 orotate phosphoribosyltransferase [Planctomycetota bacterium]
MDSNAVLALMKECDALLEGHFLLSSGLRSDRYVQCALALMHPAKAGVLGVALGEKFRDDRVDVVVGPAMGGLIIGHEVARFLGARFVFTERVDGKMQLRRGFKIQPGERCIVVEDVVTTGGSAREVVEWLRVANANVVGVGSIIDRSGGKSAFDVPFKPLATITANTWTAEDDPLAKQGSVPVKPGSRNLNTAPTGA